MVTALLGAAGSFSGEWIIGGFESKVPAWGLVLGAVAAWIDDMRQRGRWAAAQAGALCGLATALHPVTGIWAFIAIGMATLVECYRREPAESVPSIAAGCRQLRRSIGWMGMPFCVLGSAGVIPALHLLHAPELSAEQKSLANFIQVFWRLRHHMDPSEFSRGQWGYMVLLVAGLVVLEYWRRRQAPVFTAALSRHIEMRLLHRVLMASAVIAGTGVLIGWHVGPASELEGWQWRAALLKFYPFRLFDGLLPVVVSLSVMTAACRLALKRHAALSPPGEVGAAVCERSSRSGFARFLRLMRVQSGRHPVVATGLAASVIAACCFSNAPPNGYTADRFRDWQTACAWLNSNTPENALVQTPRESFGFKWFAQRAEYVAYKDCPQDAPGILEWNRRLWYLNHWTLNSSADGVYGQDDLASLHQETGCNYILTRTLGPIDAPLLLQAGEWQIYAVSPPAPAAQGGR